MNGRLAVLFLVVSFVFSFAAISSAAGGDPKAEFIGHWKGEQAPGNRPGRIVDITLAMEGGNLVVKEYKKGPVQAGPMTKDMKPTEYETGAVADAAYEGDTPVLTIKFRSGTTAVFQKKGADKIERVRSMEMQGTLKKVGN